MKERGKIMIEIKDLLARFNNILLGEEGKKEAIINIISEIIGVKIKSEDVKIKNGTIYLNIKPIYKNEILLKQEQIFLKLKESFGKKTPTALR
jgi:DNA replication protein DnaD